MGSRCPVLFGVQFWALIDMPLTELLEKSGEGDFRRAVAESVLQLLMEADVEGLIGAG